MSNFPIYHGITLAANSFIENLVVEKLEFDPIPVEAGRVWYNTTEKTFKQSSLVGAVVTVFTFSTLSDLTAAVNVEKTRALAAEATLTANLDGEITRATAAESTLTANLLVEVTRATAAESTLTANLLVEKTRALAAESTLTVNLDSEITRATAAESTLTANLLVEKTRATAAETTLQANIDAEKTRATGVEGNLASLTTTAKSNLVASINEIVSSFAGGTEALRDDYDATVFIYDSTDTNQNPGAAAQTSYVVAHGLNHNFVDVGVWIKRADGSYYNDIVSVKTDTASQVTVYLSTAQHIKVVCRSALGLGLVGPVRPHAA